MMSYTIKSSGVESLLTVDSLSLRVRPDVGGVTSEFMSERAMAVLSRAARRNVFTQQEFVLKSSTAWQPSSKKESFNVKYNNRNTPTARKSHSSSAPPAIRQPPKIIIEEASLKQSEHSSSENMGRSPNVVQCSSAPLIPGSVDIEGAVNHRDGGEWCSPPARYPVHLTRPRYRTMSGSSPRTTPATTDWDWVRSRLLTRDSGRRPESSMTFDDFLNGLDLDSDEYDTDLEDTHLDEKVHCDPTGIWHYKNLCKIKGVGPARKVLHALKEKHTHFKLNHRYMNSKDVAAMTCGLQHSKYVQELDLSDNGLNNKGVMYVANMMRNNSRIHRLDLSANFLNYDAGRYIAQVMLTNDYLTHLCMKRNKLEDKEALLLAKVLSNNKSLESLDVSHNQFTDDAGEAFAIALIDNTCLTSLNLSWNTLCKRTAAALARALTLNSTLLSLDLSWNGLGDEGAALLGYCLRSNSTLRYLSLAVNHICGYGAEQLASGLAGGIVKTKKKKASYGKSDSSLHYLNLDQNPLGIHGIKILLMVLEEEAKLKTLSIRQVLLNADVRKQIRRMLRTAKPDVILLYEGQDLTLQTDVLLRRGLCILNDKLRPQKTNIINIIKSLNGCGRGVEVSDLRNYLLNITQSLTEIELEDAIKGLDVDGDGFVHYRDVAVYCSNQA